MISVGTVPVWQVHSQLRKYWRMTKVIELQSKEDSDDRRQKARFPIQRELRYRVMHQGKILEAGLGTTVNIGSGGVAFAPEHELAAGAFIELSISWPVQLENGTPMRLVTFGRVLRSGEGVSACTVDKYEFRTQSRTPQTSSGPRNNTVMPRWFDRTNKQTPKLKSATPVGYTALRA